MALKLLQNICPKLFQKESREWEKLLNTDPTPDETVTRYLLSSSHFSASKARVKPRAFEPCSHDNATSVFRISSLNDDQIWEMGKTIESSERHIKARADLTVADVLSFKLSVIKSEPPPRHALINSWPAEKHSQMSLAQNLAAAAILKVKQ